MVGKQGGVSKPDQVVERWKSYAIRSDTAHTLLLRWMGFFSLLHPPTGRSPHSVISYFWIQKSPVVGQGWWCRGLVWGSSLRLSVLFPRLTLVYFIYDPWVILILFCFPWAVLLTSNDRLAQMDAFDWNGARVNHGVSAPLLPTPALL